MAGFTIIVEFITKAGGRDRFLELVRVNGAASVRDEPGCRRFDILTGQDENRVVLYEIYDDEAAFQEHLRTPHFHSFRAGIEGLVERSDRQEFYDVTENDKRLPPG